MVKIIECPRDAMQGIDKYIPVDQKVAYMNTLLRIGFDTIDFGSFVSPKAIPQMRDTREVIEQLDLSSTLSKLLAIVANVKGAQDASEFPSISFLGYPLSVSETFQQRNTNRSVASALEDLQEIQNICARNNKELVTYLSMGFGNPYGDPYSTQLVIDMIGKLQEMGLTIFSLADTTGIASPSQIRALYQDVIGVYVDCEIGLHLHAVPSNAQEKIEAAIEVGCSRIDGALRGYGGCPMAADKLTGNVPTEIIIACLQEKGFPVAIDQNMLEKGLSQAMGIFS